MVEGFHSPPDVPGIDRSLSEELLRALSERPRHSLDSEASASLRVRLRSLFLAGPGMDDDDSEGPQEQIEEEDDECGIGSNMPVPCQTFLEQLSQAVQVHPISVYWLLKDGIEKKQWVCPAENDRLVRDRLSVLALRLLGHRWPVEIEAGELPYRLLRRRSDTRHSDDRRYG